MVEVINPLRIEYEITVRRLLEMAKPQPLLLRNVKLALEQSDTAIILAQLDAE